MIDLHLHSTHSDGTLTPAELVRVASMRGLSAIAITDHDTATGTGEAMAAGGVRGLTVISGLELNVVHDTTSFHLLGYDFDWKDSRLVAGLTRLQGARQARNSTILTLLQERGIGVCQSELEAVSGGGQTGRPHIARLLVRLGVVKTIDEAFDRYLKKGACAYAPRFILTAGQALEMIHGAGGVGVLAHPVQLDRSLATLPELLDELVGIGLDGLEVYYPTQKGKVRRKLSALAGRYNLLMTGGSDFHGDMRPGTSMAGGSNLTVPAELLDRLLDGRQRTSGTADGDEHLLQRRL